MLETWTTLLGPEFGPRVARTKGLSALLAFVAVVLAGMGVVLGADAAFLAVSLLVVAVLALVSAGAFLLLSLMQISADVARRLGSAGTPPSRPPLLLRSRFERWRGAVGLDAQGLRARL